MNRTIKRFKRTDVYQTFRRTVLKSRIYEMLNIAGYDVRTKLANSMDSSDLDAINTFCLFIGHGRSGHSIVGALLDAHPNVILSDETDILKYLLAGFDAKQLYRTLIYRSQKQTRIQRRKDGLNGKYYSYRVPGQWQGKYTNLQVIGDSKAAVTTMRLYRNPDLLKQLRICTGVDLRVVHVVRNPFDNISTISIRHSRSLDTSTQQYFYNCEAVMDIRKLLDHQELITVHHEELISNPKTFLTKLTNFISVKPLKDYLNACSDIIYSSPSKTRHKVIWDNTMVNRVEKNINRFDFLAGYSYEN